SGSSLETIRHMVVGGLGITVLPQSSAANRPEDRARLLAKPFVPPAPHRRIALVWRKTFPRRQAITQLRDAILACGMKGVQYLPDAEMPQD
ncbi:MAG: LysR substrate-binding domain-containing protein, partial [Solimonas sp.]